MYVHIYIFSKILSTFHTKRSTSILILSIFLYIVYKYIMYIIIFCMYIQDILFIYVFIIVLYHKYLHIHVIK